MEKKKHSSFDIGRREHLLGIDYGLRRTGIALGHQVAQIASAFEVVESDLPTLIDRIIEISAQEGVHTIVVGMPRNMDGSLGVQSQIVDSFIEQLQARIADSIEIKVIDETLSTAEAARYASKGTAANDAHSAAVILNRYFDEQRGQLYDTKEREV